VKIFIRSVATIIAVFTLAALATSWIVLGAPREAADWAACFGIHIMVTSFVTGSVLLWKSAGFPPTVGETYYRKSERQ
jgi:peptidoglycan/LPS O-acetylase OafA/YrhL